MSDEPPLVSCLMPTADRRAFVPTAIAQFLAQDYPRRELVVVDDGADSIEDLLPEDPAVRYHRLPSRLALGAKRNLACELARGEIVVHWDDDDWIAPWRVSTQVGELVASGADVCGLRTLLFHDAAAGRAWRYTYPPTAARPWVAGATMAYRRAFWERNRFPELRNGEDTRFLWTSHPKNVLAVEDDSWFIASIHPRNTSVKRPAGSRWRAVPIEEVRSRHAVVPLPRPSPSPARSRRLVPGAGDVVIGVHVHAQPEGLMATLANLFDLTAAGIRVVVIPDDPDAGAAAALARLCGVEVLPEPGRPGAAACLNQLAASVEAETYVLLESGATGGPGWLAPLLAALRKSGVGLAGPSTNRSWNPQQVVPGCDGTVASLERSARLVRARYGDQVRSLAPLHSLAEFCYALRREVWDEVGPADESYGRGPCWEMDYNALALRHGFAGVWAAASFLHRRPFTPARQRAEDELFAANKRRYQDKYCGRRLRGTANGYEDHCRGDACPDFAPVELILPNKCSRPVASPSRRVAAPTVPEVPLVSCIMPTARRAAWVSHAVRLFALQDHPRSELLIVADAGTGTLPDDLAGDVPGVRVLNVPAGTNIGAKRNLGCEAAAGDIVAHWDDDDWYGPERLSHQIRSIVAGEADITALVGGVYLDLATWQFWSPSPELHARLFRGDVHGGTLVFRRSLWTGGTRYPTSSLAEDAAFLLDAIRSGARLARVPAGRNFVYVRHGTVSWPFRIGQGGGWRAEPEPPLPSGDRQFYQDRQAADFPITAGRRVAARR